VILVPIFILKLSSARNDYSTRNRKTGKERETKGNSPS
jgi:hypothetical protein